MLQWVVDQLPDQSLLNTAGWKYVIPQLYKKFPNDDMKLNISIPSPPTIKIERQKIDVTVDLDMTVYVVDFGEVIPVACISIVSLTRLYPVSSTSIEQLPFPAFIMFVQTDFHFC